MIHYTKIQSNGNNFLLLDNRTLKITTEILVQLTQRDCNMQTGVGADGLLILEDSGINDFKMRIFNVDGSEGEMCGNGARCIARYAFDHGIAKDQMCFETLSGPIEAEVSEESVRIGFGTLNVTAGLKEHTLEVDGESIHYRFLTVGVPHVVIFMEDNRLYTFEDMMRIGQAFDQNHVVFEKGTNVNFVRHLEESRIEVTTYERGVEAITASCGTGSSASAAVAMTRYGIVSPVAAINPGGINTVFLTGSAMQVGQYQIGLKGIPHYAAQVICPDFGEDARVLIK